MGRCRVFGTGPFVWSALFGRRKERYVFVPT